MLIDREEILSLIPHQGDMCLLDGVLDWGEASILARALSHRDSANPLRRDGVLHALHTIEYAAQAMAVHGGLLARRQGARLGAGMLAAGRDVALQVDRLDDIDGELVVAAERLHGEGGNLIYRFRVSAGAAELASGRLTVMAMGEPT